MKTIPVVTTLLITNNIYLNYLAQSVGLWHGNLFRIAGVDRAYIAAHSRLINNLSYDILGLWLLTLALLILIWKNRLCNRWWAAAISLLWFIGFVIPLTRLS